MPHEIISRINYRTTKGKLEYQMLEKCTALAKKKI